MQTIQRYAVYYAPQAGDFADAGAQWLGRDAATGLTVPQPAQPMALADWTAQPRRYGFHATLKPPFRLASGLGPTDLQRAVQALAHRLPAVSLSALGFVDLAGFLALVPVGDSAALSALAAAVVARLDPFRAAPTPADIARRNPDRLTPRQRDLLNLYGYPFVLDQFRFHLTLSAPLSKADLAALRSLAAAHFARHLPRRFCVADLCLFGEATDGTFHLLQRYPLAG